MLKFAFAVLFSTLPPFLVSLMSFFSDDPVGALVYQATPLIQLSLLVIAAIAVLFKKPQPRLV
jgi:hypothetical protein